MLFGTNTLNYTGTRQADVGMTTIRAYNDPAEGVPADWPGSGQLLPAGLIHIVSIKPPVDAVAAGKLNRQLTRYMAKAPDPSILTIWHEANTPRHNIDPAEYKDACHVLWCIARNNAPWVRVAQIFNCYPVSKNRQDLKPWVLPCLDYYLLDGYQLEAGQSPGNVFGQAATDINRTGVKLSQIGIAETNSASDKDLWATRAHHWAADMGFAAFAIFAGRDQFQGPPDTRVMNDIARLCAISRP